jgi:PAS domain S-box-containing protein
MKRGAAVRSGVGIALAIVLLVALVAVTYRNTRDLIEAGRWVDHTRDAIGQLGGLLTALTDAETGSRGYLLTGRREYLDPYYAAVSTVGGYLDRLDRLTGDSPRQSARLRELRRLVGQKLAVMKDDIEVRDREGLEAGAEALRAGPDRATMDAIRRTIRQMETEEHALLTARSRTSERTARETLVSLALGAALLFIFFGIIWALVQLDLLKRHEAEDQLRRSEAELRTTLRSIGDGVIATDTKGRVTLINPVAQQLTGWPEAEALGRDASEVFRIVHEDTRAELQSPVARVLREGAVVGLANHTVLISRSGGEHPIADSGAPIRNERGEIGGVVLVFRDIAEKRQAERDLQRLAAIVSSSEDAIVAESLDGRITAWNAAAERLFGYSASEVIGRSIAVLEAPGSEESTGSRLMRIRKGERVQQFDTTRLHKDGRRVDVSVSVSPIRDAQGAVVGASKIVRDITERKESELALRASEERFRVLSESVASLVWICDARGDARYMSRRWYEYTGMSTAESLGDGWTKAAHPEDLPASLAKWQTSVATGEPYDTEVRYRRHDGSYRWFVARAVRIESRSGPIWVGTSTDIDELKNTAAALREAKESAEEAAQAKDRFLAVLSHELRTPLTPALATSQLLERRGDLPAQVQEAVSLIRRNVELEALLVDDLLDLTKIARGMIELRRQPVDLHVIAQSVVDICRSDVLARRQNLALELEASEHQADADPARMQQVLWNLLKNAVKFTPVGGSIVVRTENPEPGSIRISVADTGMGIPAGILPHVFEPFERGTRTISPRASGLGLGLSISKTLVELHDGTIRAESAGEGRGATFTIEMAAFLEKHVAPPVGEAPSRSAHRLAILLVEDHSDTASALAQLLREEGHTVAVAASMVEAINLFRQRPFEIMITDLGLPDGSGHELLGRLREIRPVGGIVLSGYGMDADVARSREAGFAEHLTKPVNIGKLLRALDEAAAASEVRSSLS